MVCIRSSASSLDVSIRTESFVHCVQTAQSRQLVGGNGDRQTRVVSKNIDRKPRDQALPIPGRHRIATRGQGAFFYKIPFSFSDPFDLNPSFGFRRKASLEEKSNE